MDWGKNQPAGNDERHNQNCIALWKGVGFKWADFTCSIKTGYICEKQIVS